MTQGGYHNRYARIDASTGLLESRPLEEHTLKNFIGGAGLGLAILLQEKGAELDALAPESPIVFAFSPLVGSPLTTSAKFAVVSKSPLTDRLNDSLASSSFAIHGKRTGFDAILIHGKARELSVLVVDGAKARLEPATELKELGCNETQVRLKERYGPSFSYAVIGPAGENRVLFSTISHDGRHAGRGGAGAVLGSKNLKAIAVRGDERVSWGSPTELATYAKELSERSFGPATAKYRELGTATNLLTFNRLNALPTLNFQRGSFDLAAELSPERLSATREKTRAHCAACTIGCEHIYSLRQKEPSSLAGNLSSKPESGGVRLEYENLFALGPLCGIGDSQAVLEASQACDDYGIDTISAGGVIAFAMECVERGLVDAPWLTFGSTVALRRAIHEIANRTGIGAQLADGSRKLANQLGGQAIEFACQVKGLELPGYEPRALQTMALGLAVNARGADHNRSGAYEADFSPDTDRKSLDPTRAAKAAIETENRAAIMDSLIMCKFLRGALVDFYEESAHMLNLVTGWSVTKHELIHIANKIIDAKKAFNIAAGWTDAEDTLPERFFSAPLSDDPSARLSRESLDKARQEYYRQRGWSIKGTR